MRLGSNPRVVEACGNCDDRETCSVSQVVEVLAESDRPRPAHTARERLASFARRCPFEQHHLVGRSPATLQALNTALQAAATDATVLLTGESGTGKEVLAGVIHRYSARAANPFVAVNCAALPDPMLESELFGHVKGAYTGAEKDRKGRFERASGGTIFLDEIGDMSLALQAKILRCLEERAIERLGDEKVIPVDGRVVAATHRNLPRCIEAGKFREDLYFRLAVIVIHLPPLRERVEDIPALAEHFLTRYACQYDTPCPTLSDPALERLGRYPWPGNVRELRNVIERVIALWGDASVVGVEHLPPEIRGDVSPPIPPLEPGGTDGLLPLQEVELRHIRRVLAATGGRLAEAADVLGIHRNTLRRKMREHHLT